MIPSAVVEKGRRHVLKTEPLPFEALWAGKKLHEIRVNDRYFEEGDELVLREWLPGAKCFTNREIFARVTYATHGPEWGIPDGLVVMSVRVIQRVLR